MKEEPPHSMRGSVRSFASYGILSKMNTYDEDVRHVSSWEVDREVAPVAESALIKQEDDTPR